MGVILNQWNGTEENEVEENGLQRKRVLKRDSSTSSGSDSDKDIDQVKGVELEESDVKEETIVQQEEETENSNTILPASDPPALEQDSTITSVNNVSTIISQEIGRAIEIIVNENGEEERQELYLERVYEKPPTHGFYCPNCNVCIQKVYIIQMVQRQQQNDRIRCTSCFSFLIPIGSWLFPRLISNDHQVPNVQDSLNNNRLPQESQQYETAKEFIQSEEQISKSVTKITSKLTISSAHESRNQTLKIIQETEQQNVSSEAEDKIIATGDVGRIARNISGIKESQEEGKGEVATPRKKYFWSGWEIIRGASKAPALKKPEIDIKEKEQPEFVVRVEDVPTEPVEEVVSTVITPLLTPTEPPVPTSSKGLEILKSVVYGGLIELLASLSVVTSAASADSKTLSIVALAIANLIGGLFTLGHNLRELKAEQPKRSENSTEEPVDRYNELLGKRENFYLHSFIAMLSFIIFGLVPPVVYGFSFRETDDKDFKLAAVAVASVICITLLSIAKAYINRPNTYLTYFQTVFYYVSTGAMASVLSYLAGNFGKKLIEKVGWFEPASSNPALQIAGISVQHSGFGSY